MSDPRVATKGAPAPSLDDLEAGKTNLDIVAKIEDDDSNPTRNAAAVALKLAGASYNEIAQVLGYQDAYRARTAVERALADSAEPTDVASLRTIALRRLERLIRSTWEKSINPNHPDHLAYVRTTVVLMERMAKVAGVDAPQQVAVSVTPQYLQEWADAVARATGSAPALEAEIMGEVIEDAETVEADI